MKSKEEKLLIDAKTCNMIMFIAYVKRKDEIPGQNFNKRWLKTISKNNLNESLFY